MPKEQFKLCSYQNEEGRWLPKAEVYVEKKGETETIVIDLDGMFDYEEQKEADNHAHYMAKDYLAKQG